MYDAIVIGGGPAGSSVAARLAQHGRRVVVLEQQRFPRFHIGESLLPCSLPLFEELGAMPAIRAAGFVPKYAAEFVTGDGALRQRYAFADSLLPGPSSAYQVDRSELDRILLENARARGAEVREGVEVRDFEIGRDSVRVSTRSADGEPSELSAELLIDASGQRSLVAGRLGLRRMDRALQNFAVFSHFKGARRGTGEAAGDISVVLVPGGWWWAIPLAGDRTSIGFVGPKQLLGGRKPDEAYFTDALERTPVLRERLAPARRVADVRTIADYSYSCQRISGDRLLLVGDAAAFIDPVFSTGVHLGMSGALRAASAALRALERRRFERAAFLEYEAWVSRNVGAYRSFVKGFYTPEFVELLLHPSNWLGLRQAITALLAGHGSERLAVGLRVLVFRALVRANRSFALVPRLPERRAALAAR